MPKFGHDWDTACWAHWASIINYGGIAAAYGNHSPVNYLPLYMYVLKAYGWLVGAAQIDKYIYTLKAFTLLFDVGSVLIICSMIKTEFRQLKYFIFGLLNIGFFYNTLIWNQVDGILAFFVFASFYAAYCNRISLSFVLFLLALNFKLQGIIFLPLIGLLWLPHLKIKPFLQLILIACLVEGLILLPFFVNGNVKNILKIAFSSVDYYQSVSLNAFNFWYLFLDGNLREINDSHAFFWKITYKQMGLILFFLFSAIVCVPLYLKAVKQIIAKEIVPFDFRALLLAASLIGCFFFYFNTQMHERYIHPVLIFSTALAFLFRHLLQFVIIMAAYALSLEYVCRYFALPNYDTIVFNPRFISFLYGLVIIQLLYLWLKSPILKKELQINVTEKPTLENK